MILLQALIYIHAGGKYRRGVMIPILYDTNEIAFASNGLGRLRDCISCKVTEERNGIYECDFEYPVDGANFDQIRVGRIIGVTHDESDDIEPFDIVSYTRPINGVVTFHCTHISYRLSYLTVTGSNINSLADAFTLLGNSTPANPFTFQTDKTSQGYLASADGLPKSVRSIMGGIEGSILDAYGGEWEFNNFTCTLHSARGQYRNFTVRYGVNMLDYNEEYGIEGTYSACVPYWTDGTNKVVGDAVDSGTPTVTGRGECVPLDVSDKFEVSDNTLPTKAQVNAAGLAVMQEKNSAVPSQTIKVEFARIQDLGHPELANLQVCKLCDTIRVIFPSNNASGNFKIVKTVWDVLRDRYESMELGELSTTLAEALGVNGGGSTGSGLAINTVYAKIVSATINRAYANYVSVTAPSVDGYKFLCWAQVSTNGWVGSVYPSSPLSATCNMWNASTGQTGTGNIDCLALYVPQI